VVLKVECLREVLLPWAVVLVVLRVMLDLWVSLPIRVLQVVSAHLVLDLSEPQALETSLATTLPRTRVLSELSLKIDDLNVCCVMIVFLFPIKNLSHLFY
jgi:hypothetical protein